MNHSYRTQKLLKYFSTHRCSWEGFYESERKIIASIPGLAQRKILDMGCACGGLAAALKERFGIASYVGVEINSDCVDFAQAQHPWAKFISGDFLVVHPDLPRDFDLVFSLSCADWNVQTEKLFQALFLHLQPGGSMVFSCRLAQDLPGDARVYSTEQEISYDTSLDEIAEGASADVEFASYKVYTPAGIAALIRSFGNVSDVRGYGYWGGVPATVVKPPARRLHYTVFVVQKSLESVIPRVEFEFEADLHFPPSLFTP